MGFIAHEVLIVKEKLSDSIVDKLLKELRCFKENIVMELCDESNYLYIIKYSKDRLKYHNLSEILETSDDIFYIEYDDSYSENITLCKYLSNEDDRILYVINDNALYNNDIDLTLMLENIGLNCITIEHINKYFNNIYT